MEASEVRKLMEEQLLLSRKLRARIRELEEAKSPKYAVVGLATRLPGDLNTPDAYWRFLRSDSLALSDIPEDRKGLRAVYSPDPNEPGRSYVKRCGFLGDIAGFDASFFGISQREAEALDPQQRMLLETAWEAMERAGIPVRRQDRISVGVFVGIMASEYGERVAGKADKSQVDPYYGTGGGHCFAAGRISYAMGFSGPALSVDTACSSSLVAFHLATQSLQRGECRYGLVAGSNLILSADLMVSLAQSKALAPDGRSKTFTADADGYGRGEGIGAMVLMRLEDAERESRPILAVVRGSAVNHDGASSGLTVPSGPAQQEVIRSALRNARVEAREVGYVEAHGTGTALGDPIEVGALDAVLGSGADGRHVPVAIGSVKRRIGHLEAAAGVAGLIKLVLMLHHGQIPAALSEADGELNELVPWDRLKLVVPRRSTRWPGAFESRLAGISAFGLSGTNAHAVLEGYDPAPIVAAQPAGRELLVLSAKTPGALEEMVRELQVYLSRVHPDLLPSVCHTLRGRAPLRYRLAVLGRTPAELSAALTAAAARAREQAPVAAVLATNVRLSPDTERLCGGLASLVSAFPALAGQVEGMPISEQLGRVLAALGLRTRIATDPALRDAGAVLEWADHACPILGLDPEDAPDLFLEALQTLLLSGVDLRLESLGRSGARTLSDVPTYAFQRKRYWIEEELPSEAGARGGDPIKPVPRLSLAPSADSGVEAFLVSELCEVLRLDQDLDRTQTFLDVGGDSFTAMLLKKSIEMQYGFELPQELLSVEQPLEQLIASLRDYIEVVSGAKVSCEEKLA